MNLKTIPEADLFGLLKMTEGEQVLFLRENRIIQKKATACTHCLHLTPYSESLADLAERLWEEVVVSLEILKEITYKVWGLRDTDDSIIYENWVQNALPIHRIVAALLATKRAEEAPTKSSVSGLGFTLYSIRTNRTENK